MGALVCECRCFTDKMSKTGVWLGTVIAFTNPD